MFKVNDTVIYGSVGLCTVSEIKKIDFNGTETEYYILLPEANKSTIYVPRSKEDGRLRELLTKEEAQDLLSRAGSLEALWEQNNISRKITFQEYMKTGNALIIARILKGMYINSKERERQNKKIHVSDSKITAEAERSLFGELAKVLERTTEDIREEFYRRIAEE